MSKYRKKKVKRTVQRGVAFVVASFSNTQITITDLNGEVLVWSSSGCVGFSGSRKGTPFAAQRAAEVCGENNRPESSRSAMTLRIVAGDSGFSRRRDKVREPTGWPVCMNSSTSRRNTSCDRPLSSYNTSKRPNCCGYSPPPVNVVSPPSSVNATPDARWTDAGRSVRVREIYQRVVRNHAPFR